MVSEINVDYLVVKILKITNFGKLYLELIEPELASFLVDSCVILNLNIY